MHSLEPGAEANTLRYFIDLDWLERNSRSFILLARSRLCPRNHPNLGKTLKADRLLAVFPECCASREDFITADQPILESLFRLFLAAGNQPLSLEEIRQQLERRRESKVPAAEVLQRLLDGDAFYGLRRLEEAPVG